MAINPLLRPPRDDIKLSSIGPALTVVWKLDVLPTMLWSPLGSATFGLEVSSDMEAPPPDIEVPGLVLETRVEVDKSSRSTASEVLVDKLAEVRALESSGGSRPWVVSNGAVKVVGVAGQWSSGPSCLPWRRMTRQSSDVLEGSGGDVKVVKVVNVTEVKDFIGVEEVVVRTVVELCLVVLTKFVEVEDDVGNCVGGVTGVATTSTRESRV